MTVIFSLESSHWYINRRDFLSLSHDQSSQEVPPAWAMAIIERLQALESSRTMTAEDILRLVSRYFRWDM